MQFLGIGRGVADDTEAKYAHEEKSTGSHIEKGVGLRLSLSIFVIWALSCL